MPSIKLIFFFKMSNYIQKILQDINPKSLIHNFINVYFFFNQIIEHTDSNNYQIACQRYFEFSHKTDELIAVNHPNQYFEQSMRLTNGNNYQKPNRPNVKIEHIKVEMTQ